MPISREEIIAALESDAELIEDQVSYLREEIEEAILSFLKGEERAAIDTFRSICQQIEANTAQLLSDYYDAVSDGTLEED